jgi:hypothetical protein
MLPECVSACTKHTVRRSETVQEAQAARYLNDKPVTVYTLGCRSFDPLALPCSIPLKLTDHSCTTQLVCFTLTFQLYTFYCCPWDSVVGIATDYGLDDRGVGVPVPEMSRIFFSSCRQDRLWAPSSLLSDGYRGHFPRGESGQDVKLTTLQLVPRSRKCGSIYTTPRCAFMA